MRDNCPIVGAILFAIDMYIRRLKWYAKPCKTNSAKALENAEFLDTVISDLTGQTFADVISEAMSMLVPGWSIAEKVYKIRNKENSKFPDGKVGIKKFGFRSQETLYEWIFDENNNLIGMIQENPITFQHVKIPIEKMLLFRTKTIKDNPQGRSILRNAYRSYFFKTRLEEFEAIGLEHDALGVLVGWVQQSVLTSTTQTDTTIRQNFANAIRKVQTNKGSAIILPLKYDDKGNKLFDLTLLETKQSGGSQNTAIAIAIERYETRISQSCLFELTMLGNKKGSSGGSYAMAEVKSNDFVKALGTFLEIIKSVFNNNWIPELFRLNGITDELPTIECTELTKMDITAIGAYLKDLSLSGANLWPNPQLLKFLMMIADLPEPSDEDLQNIDDSITEE
jgi:hypothetical protein